jgi:hypothetical protein
MIGSGNHVRSSRLRRGHSPARKNGTGSDLDERAGYQATVAETGEPERAPRAGYCPEDSPQHDAGDGQRRHELPRRRRRSRQRAEEAVDFGSADAIERRVRISFAPAKSLRTIGPPSAESQLALLRYLQRLSSHGVAFQSFTEDIAQEQEAKLWELRAGAGRDRRKPSRKAI